MTAIGNVITVIKDIKLITDVSQEWPNRLVEVLTLVSYILEVPGSKLIPQGKFWDSTRMSNYTTPVSFNISSISLVIAIQ